MDDMVKAPLVLSELPILWASLNHWLLWRGSGAARNFVTPAGQLYRGHQAQHLAQAVLGLGRGLGDGLAFDLTESGLAVLRLEQPEGLSEAADRRAYGHRPYAEWCEGHVVLWDEAKATDPAEPWVSQGLVVVSTLRLSLPPLVQFPNL